MKRILIVVTAGIFSIYFVSICSAQKTGKIQSQLRSQIVIYNLINGLYLTEDQMRFILNKAKEVSRARKELMKQAEENLAQQTQLLEELKDEVKNEVPEVSEELARKVHQNTELEKRLRKEYLDIVNEAVGEVKMKLDKTQLYNIQNFVPCLVPPKGPSRIGQDTSSGGVANILERIRKMRSGVYFRRKENIAERFVEMISLKNSHVSQESLDKAKEEILRIMDEVRGLSDVDFELQKQDKIDELKTLMDGTQVEKKDNLEQRIARFLLSEEAISVLGEKLYGN